MNTLSYSENSSSYDIMAATEFNTRVKQHIESKRIPALGGILLNKSGEHIYNEAFGTVNVNDDRAPVFTTNTEILLFSCTKLIVGICALQLVERGLLALDDPVSKYFPKINELKIANKLDSNGQPITRAPQNEMKIVHLLTHSSGITYDLYVRSLDLTSYLTYMKQLRRR